MLDAPTVDVTAADSEQLARRFFGLIQRNDMDGMLELVHPEIEWVLKSTHPGDVLRGSGEVEAFLAEIAGKFYELVTEVYRPLDDERIVVEGRMRWMDDARILRDDPVIWALVFRGGLLWRSAPAQSLVEAEALLAPGG